MLPRLRAVLLVLALVGLFAAGIRYYRQIEGTLLQAGWPELAGSLISALAARGIFAAGSWVVAVRSYTDGRVGNWGAVESHYRAGVARYLPGGVWHPVSSFDRLVLAGARSGEALAVTLLDTLVPVVMGLALGLGVVSRLMSDDPSQIGWLLVGIPLVALLHPAVLHFSINKGARLMGRSFVTPPARAGTVAKMAMLHVANLATMGIQLWLVFRALGLEPPLPLIISASSLAWAIGWLFLVAPAGLGAREGALVLLLGGVVGSGPALFGAIVVRLELVVVDLVAFVVSMIFSSPRRGQR